MATLATSTRHGLRNGDWSVSLNIYNIYTNADLPAWIHFKTNVGASDGCMCVIEAVGYNYGAAAAVRAVWSFYTTGGTLYDRGVLATSGLASLGRYLSSDSKVCLRCTYPPGTSHYYNGFVLHAYVGAPHPPYGGVDPVSITAVTQSSNSGNYY